MSCQGRIPAPFELSEEWSVLRGAVSAGNTPRDRERKRKEEAAQVLIKMLLAVGNYFDVPPEKICRRQSFIFIFGNIELGTHRNFSFSLRFFLKVGKWKVAFSIFGSLFIYLFLLSFDSFQEFSFLVLDHLNRKIDLRIFLVSFFQRNWKISFFAQRLTTNRSIHLILLPYIRVYFNFSYLCIIKFHIYIDPWRKI